ncbi:MAG: twin-arginine translocation signal domain-containing protein [Bryobacteraceae bacterium]
MARSKKISVDRRGFLKGAAAGAAAGDKLAYIEALPTSPDAKKHPADLVTPERKLSRRLTDDH